MAQVNPKPVTRQAVLDAAYKSIDARMTRHSVRDYIDLAEEYAKCHGIEPAVREWILEGRQEFPSEEAAREWADSLPFPPEQPQQT